jgi:type I restriction enzyme M protein
MDNNEYLKIQIGLRGLGSYYKSNVSEEDLLIVKCFLLLLRKEGLLKYSSSNLSNRSPKLLIQDAVENSHDNDLKNLYYEYLKPLVDSVRKTYLAPLFDTYVNISDGFIKDRAIQFFDREVENAFKSHGHSQSDSLQPKELTELLNYFCDTSKVQNYYNPFAGIASLALSLPAHIRYLGEEINQKTWLVGKLRMYMYERSNSMNYQCANSIEKWTFPTADKYDFIGFNPPLNLRLKPSDIDFLDSEYAYARNANSLIISKCFDMLDDDGKMVFVMSSGFLFSNAKKDINLKKELVDNGHVEKVIALPERIFNFTSIGVNIIVLNKVSNTERKIDFIDASDKFKLGDGKINILDNDAIFKLFDSDKNSKKGTVHINEISKNGYNLSVNRYVFEDLNLSVGEAHNLVRLKDLVTPLPRTTETVDGDVKFVRIRDLSNSPLESIKSFKDIEIKNSTIRISPLLDNSLLLATTWKSLKPTVYKKQGENIYYDSNSIFACTVDESKVDLDYLILELNKDYIQKQLEQRSIGTSISRINRKDLLQIEVVVPDRSTQEKRKLDFKESVIKEHQEKFETLKKQLGVDIADENSFLRHKISGTLKNIRGSYNKLKDIIDNQISKDLPEVYEYKLSPKLTTNLGDYLSRLDRDIKSVHRAVKNVGLELTMLDIKLETMNFIKFIEDYVEEVKSRPHINFLIDLDIDEEALKDNKIKEVNFRGDKEILYQVFDNIIENAERHAFYESGKDENRINVLLLYDFEELNVQLDFANNGKPLPEDYSHEAFTRKGSTAGKNAGNGLVDGL